MSTLKSHLSSHPSHLVGCGVAALLVIAAIVFSVPVLAVLGAALCGAMMIGMVWMMFSMAARARH
jgi:hypothetical protein